MKFGFAKRWWAPLICLVLVGSAGCGWFGDSSGTDSQAFDTPAQVLASDAEARYNEGEFKDAAELFQQLKDRFPYSRYALLADLRVGDAHFKAGSYEEAVLAYEDFIRLHPKNEAVPYAIYQTGMVYHKQMLTVDRDPTMARRAKDAFERLNRNYSKSQWAIKARPRLQEALAHLAGHDLFVGKFYFRVARYKAAMGRFQRVLTQYPDVGLYGEAMEYLKRCEVELAKLSPEERERGSAEQPIRPVSEGAVGESTNSVLLPPLGGSEP